MALSESIAAYEDCFDHFDRARNSKKGIRIFCDNQKSAGYLRMRLNQARVLQRREAMRVYEREDPRYGKSENDGYCVSVVEAVEGDGSHWVYITPWAHKASGLEIEELE